MLKNPSLVSITTRSWSADPLPPGGAAARQTIADPRFGAETNAFSALTHDWRFLEERTGRALRRPARDEGRQIRVEPPDGSL